MTKNATKTFEDASAAYLEGLQRFAELSMANAQKIGEMQVATAKTYVDISVDEFKALAEMKDGKAVPAYLKAAPEKFQAVGKKMVEDMTTFANMSAEYGKEVQALATELGTKIMPKAAS